MQKSGKNPTYGNKTIKKMHTLYYKCAHFSYILRYTLGVTPYFFLNTRMK